MRRLAFLLALLLPLSALAQTAEPSRVPSTYRQSAAVLAHYPAVPDVILDSPGFRDPQQPTLTSQEAMLDFLRGLARESHRMVLGSIGRSTEGREIPILYFTAEGLSDPVAIRQLGRPIIWLIGQQHGNEPAGGEAMLALASLLAKGRLAPILARITVVIVPRLNVDGAAADRRTLASGADSNRDHLLLSQPEVRELHQAMQALSPDVIFDHHEFSVAWRWMEKFKGLQASDVMILEATNPSIPKALTDIARGLYRPALEQAMQRHGLSSFDYVTTEARLADRRVSLGGTAPGIARNTFGLRGSVSYLIETRGVGIGLQSYQRRVATHLLLAEAVLEVSAADPDALLGRLAGARAAAAEARGDLIVTHQEGERDVDLPLIDAESGAPKPTTVRLIDSRDIRPVDVRSRPLGYLVLRGAKDVAGRLALNDVGACEVATAGRVAVEAYDVTRTETTRSREAINPDQSVRVTLRSKTLDVPSGTLFVPMAQHAAGIVAAALEPDSPGSYVGVGVIPMAAGETEAPVYRVPMGTKLPLKPCEAR
ncbi:MAG TPA: M14 family zinc carboxypeptidase [Reyranella sp.]|nr:M14 family zinc carboxypeptidase [Reyranella sp.]